MNTGEELGESMILEEEIDENYEPTEQEILEYAKFLGMDVNKEKDLFWIAREGLKAPLPGPWKPCQTKEGEIYYFNFESGESQWEHPCDEYYKKMYEKEKVKKQGAKLNTKKETKQEPKVAAKKDSPLMTKQQQQQQQAPGFGPTAWAKQDHVPTFGEKPTTSGAKSKLAMKTQEALAFAGDIQKKADPLLKAQQEKKMNSYKEKKEFELKERKEKLDKEIEEKKQQVEKEHKKALEALEKKYKDLRKAEEEKLREEYKPLDETDIPREKAKYAEQIKKELEKDLETKLEKHKETLEKELDNIKSEFQITKREKLKEVNNRIAARYKDKIEDLELEISKLRAATSPDKSQSEDQEARMKESLLKAFMNEQETKFQLEMENVKKQINQETRALKAKEDEKYQEELNKLYKEFDKETKSGGGFDEERYKNELEIDLKAKLEQYKIQVNRKFEIMKLNSLEKLKDYEKQKLEEFRAGLGNELGYLEDELNKEKANLESQFQKDKIKAERKVEEDIAAYRELNMKKLDEKKRLLDNEKLEKLNMLKIKLSTLKGVNQDDLKSTEAKLSEIEERIRSFQSTLEAKQEEYRKELSIKEKLQTEIADLETRMSGSSDNSANNVTDPETRHKIEQLTKILKEKNQQIEILKSEKLRAEPVQSSPGLNPQAFDLQKGESQGEGDSFEMDRIHLDLEEIKKFIRGRPKDDYDYKERIDSDTELRNNYKHYNLPSAKEAPSNNISMELSRDRLVLEKKKAKLLKDLEMATRDQEIYRGDKEKQIFLRDIKKLIQQKLSRVNSQLEYLIKLSGRLERSASLEKTGQKSFLMKYNNFVEDTHSEAFSEDVDTS